MPSVSIFIRSYRKDFEWLSYCLRSINKFATGFAEVIVAVPEGDKHLISHLTAETVIGVHDGTPGYMCQQLDKLKADRHTEADYIVHLDSDCIYTRPITPEYFFKDELPSWTITPFHDCSDTERKAWMHVMVKALHKMPEHEFMRRNCMIIPRWIYPLFRKFMEDLHSCTIDQYIMRQPGHEFSEFNVIGFYSWLNHRDKFHWHNTIVDGVPDWPFIQKWSYGGLTPAIKDEFERILA